MLDFAEQLRALRAGPPDREGQGMEAREPHRHAMDVFANGYHLGYGAGYAEGHSFVPTARESGRMEGFDLGVRSLLTLTLLGLQEVVGELESRRAHKVMNERARGKLNELVEQLGGVGVALPGAVDGAQMQMDAVAAELARDE